MAQQFLQGENVNHILSSIHYNLSNMGINWDFKNDEEVWVGDLRELFDDVPPILYQYNNMRFIFFIDEGKTNSSEGDNMRMKLVSLVPELFCHPR